MKTLFSIICILVFGISYCQDYYPAKTKPNIQPNIQKKKGLQLIVLVKDSEVNTINPCGCLFRSLLPTYFVSPKNYKKAMYSSAFIKIENYVTMTSRNYWKTKPPTQQRLDELRNFLKEPKADFRYYFN